MIPTVVTSSHKIVARLGERKKERRRGRKKEGKVEVNFRGRININYRLDFLAPPPLLHFCVGAAVAATAAKNAGARSNKKEMKGRRTLNCCVLLACYRNFGTAQNRATVID